MDIRDYLYFVTFYKNGSITEAANKLFITQPSLSVYIKHMEERLGLKLFQRIDGKVSLTYAGKKYVEYAQKIMDLDDRLMQEMENIRHVVGGEVTMGISAVRGEGIIPKLLPEFKAKYPDIKVKIVEGNSSELEKLLRNKELDLAIISQYHDLEHLEYTEIIIEKIGVAIPADYTICKEFAASTAKAIPCINLERLKDYPFVLLTKGRSLRRIADDLFLKAGYTPVVYSETPGSKIAFSLTSAGMGISFLPDTFFEYFGEVENETVRFFWICNPPTTAKVVVAYTARTALNQSARALLDTIEAIKWDANMLDS